MASGTNDLVTLGLDISNTKKRIESQTQSIAKNIKMQVTAGLDKEQSTTKIQNDINSISKNLKLNVQIETSAVNQQLKSVENTIRNSSKNVGAVRVPFQFDLSDSNAVKQEINKIVAEITNNRGELINYKIDIDGNGQASKVLLAYRNELNEVTKAELKLQNVGKWYDSNGIEHNILKWAEGHKVVYQNIEATTKANQKQIESDNQVIRKKEELIAQMNLLNTQANKAGISLNSENQNKFNDLSVNASTLEDIKQLESYLRLARTEYQTFNAEISKGTHATSLETMQNKLQSMPTDIALLEARFNSIKMPENVKVQIEQLKTDLESINSISEPNAKIEKYNELNATLQNLQKQYQITSQEQKNLNSNVQATQEASILTNNIVTWMGQNSSAAAQYDAELKQIIANLQNVGSKTDVTLLAQQFRKIKTQVEASGVSIKGFFGNLKTQLQLTLTNMLKYQLTYRIIQEITQAFRTMINAVCELDASLTEFNKVADLTNEQLSDFTDRAYKAADEIGRTGKSLIDAATEFKRAGYDLDQSLEAGKAALIMTNVADGIDQTSDAASTLISVLKGFNISDSDIMTIVDKMNSVSNQSPVGFDDLAEGLKRVSGTMNQAGNSIDQTIGLLTGGFAQLRNMEKVSSGLITISQRLRAVDEDGSEIDGLSAELSEAFGKIGISIENSNGELRSTYSIMSDYAKVFPTLTSEQKQYYAELSAGKRQVNVFNAIIQQMSDVDKAIEQSIDSVGSAEKENETYRKSIQGMKNEFDNAVQTFSREVISSDWIKDLISAGTDFLEVLTNIVSQDDLVSETIKVITGALKEFASVLKELTGNKDISTLIKGFLTFKTILTGMNLFNSFQGKIASQKAMNAFFQSAVNGTLQVENGIVKIGEAEAATAARTNSLTTSMKALSVSSAPFLEIAALLAAVYATYKGVELVQDWADGTLAINKYNKALEKSEKTIEDNKTKLSEYQSEMDSNNSKIEELQKLASDDTITEAQKAELDNLIYQNALLDEKIEKLQQINDEETKNQAKTAVDKFNTEFGGNAENQYNQLEKDNKNEYGEVNDTLLLDGMENDKASDQLLTLKYFTDAYNKAAEDLANGVEGATQEDVDYYAEALDEAKKQFTSVSDGLWNDLEDQKAKLEAVRGTSSFDENAYNNIISWENVFKNYVEEYAKAIKKAQEYADANAIQQSVEFDNKETKTATLADLQSEADLLSTIQKELKENGKISTSSMQSIIKQYPEAKEALADYMSGVISEQELFEELEKVYEKDKDQYIKSLVAKNEKDEEFWNSLKTNYPEMFNQLADVYGNDVKNWANMEQAKYQATTNIIKNLASAWGIYFSLVSEQIGAAANLLSGYMTMYGDAISGYHVGGTLDDTKLAELYGQDSEEVRKANEIWNATKSMAEASEEFKNKAKALADIDLSAYDQVSSNIDLSYNGLSDKSDSSDKSNTKSYDLIERAIDKVERKISKLSDTADDTFSTWSERNSALADEIDSVTEKINLQEQAYNKYMQLANSVGLDDYYKDLIKNGAIDVIEISDENLQKQIDAFQDYYDKAQNCNDEIGDLNKNLKELQKTKFDNIISQFEDLKSSLSHTVTMIDKYIDLSQEHGYFVSLDLYEKQIETYNKDLSMLYSERDSLNNKLQESVNNGLVEEGSEAWYDMKKQINSVNEEIIDMILNIQKVRSAILELDFSKFELTQDSISDLASEADFYINLIEKMGNDLYDEDGNITNDGLTVQGLHAQNYETYLKQADYYAKKIAEIETELANDPANTTLLNKKQEYIEMQRESVLSAQDEKNAMIDLIKEGYDKQIDALSELIQKKKDALSAEKDLHDYQKSIQEKSDNVTNLKKQLKAYENDGSEEAMAKIQELTVSLKEAEDDLAESEYDKYIEDQEKLLDDLQTEYEEMINERIDNIDKELGDITKAVNGNADIIRKTLTELSRNTELPLTKAMVDIWTNATPVMDLDTTVSEIGTTVSGTTSAIDNLVTSINDLIAQMKSEMDAEIKSLDDGSYTSPDNSSSAPSDDSDYPSNDYSYDSSSDSDNDRNEDVFIYKYYYPQELNTDTSVVDRLKFNNIDAEFDRRSDYWDALFGDEEYTGSDEQNIRFLDWLKEHGYANGTRSATKGLHLFDENGLGSEVIITKEGALRQFSAGDNVFDAESTKNLWNLAQIDPSRLMPNLNLNTNIPDFVNRNVSQSVDVGGVNINLPNVKNYPEFKNELMRDKNFTNYMSEKLLGQALGHNELAANKYLR